MLLTVVVMGWPLTASAHGGVAGTTPGAGSRLADAPSQVRVEFTVPVVRGTLVLEDALGKDWSAGAVRVEGVLLERAVGARLADGNYLARWSAVTDDGTPLNGVLRFRVGVVPDDGNPFDDVITPHGIDQVRNAAIVGIGLLTLVTGAALAGTYTHARR
ncbi:copper resistance protein CopC [Kribbella italica]|uniref:Methionine-rich copper-binding protein CopC n=1 Tax=Kribbella italica TaxID=1540520 RepID=A0A7W9JFU0_9ACTN|nr:methionine-rich copper-binding protein CopC [Kribbella italica]